MELLDRYLPAETTLSQHQEVIEFSPAVVWDALGEVDLGASPVLRILYSLRGIPATGGLGDCEKIGFKTLHEDPPHHLVLGLIGKFWRVRGGFVGFEPSDFTNFDQPGYAKAVWGFEITGAERGPSTVVTETRVQCTDPASEKRFRRYWALVAPFSSVSRQEMLRVLRKAAEQR